jgi:hypothetical protein
MLHARRAIVRAVVARLGGIAAAPGGVHEGRARPKAAADAPYLCVYARPEESAPLTAAGPARKLQRQLTLAVDACTAEAGAELGDALFDALALEIETTLAADQTLGGACRDLFLARTDPQVPRAEGEHRVGIGRLEFTVTYFTAANAPHQAV